jgi:hypothetical protein
MTQAASRTGRKNSTNQIWLELPYSLAKMKASWDDEELLKRTLEGDAFHVVTDSVDSCGYYQDADTQQVEKMYSEMSRHSFPDHRGDVLFPR